MILIIILVESDSQLQLFENDSHYHFVENQLQ
jgi:hypothetical protein